MGLDITAYRGLVPIPGAAVYNEMDWETEWCPGAGMEFSEEHWPGRGEGVDAFMVYSFAESLSFRAGSYSGYNEWRRELRKLADQVGGGAFIELINFADNEGVIGPVVAKKLLRDFTDYAAAAEALFTPLEDGEWILDKYRAWQRAFELAADGGAVDFH